MKFEDSLPSPSRLLKLANQSFSCVLSFSFELQTAKQLPREAYIPEASIWVPMLPLKACVSRSL